MVTEKRKEVEEEEKKSENSGPLSSCWSTAWTETDWNADRSCQLDASAARKVNDGEKKEKIMSFIVATNIADRLERRPLVPILLSIPVFYST